MTYPALIFIGLMLWSFSWPKENLVYLLFGSYAFGALALIPPNLVAGANLMPSSTTALLLVMRYGFNRRFVQSLPQDAFRFDKMGMLTAFMAVAVIAGVFYPRLFAFQVNVVTLGGGAMVGPLTPTGQNFNQIAYLSVSYFAAMIIQYSSRDPRFVQKLLRSFIVGGAVLVLTGLADLALGGGGRSAAFAPFKTAAYAILEGAEILGARRIVGLMSEASTYGWACVLFASLTLFSSPLLDSARAKLFCRIIAYSLVAMAALSTSSTAYAGLGVLGALYGLNFLYRGATAFVPSLRRRIRFFFLAEFLLITLIVAVISGVAVTSPDLFLTPVAFVDELLFRKSLGSSYYERMSWNRFAMDALAQTHWIGVGTGGARTSNWFVAILSNTGILGAALLFGFISFQLLRPSNTRDPFARNVLVMARATIVANLSMAALAGTTSDFGLVPGALFGLIVSITTKERAARPATLRSARILRFARRRARAPLAVAKEAAQPQRAPFAARAPLRSSAKKLQKVKRWDRLRRLPPKSKRWQRMQGRVAAKPAAGPAESPAGEGPVHDNGELEPIK